MDTVGDGCQVLTLQMYASNTCPSTEPDAHCVPGTVQIKIQRRNYYYRAGAATTRVHYCTRAVLTDYHTDGTCSHAHK